MPSRRIDQTPSNNIINSDNLFVLWNGNSTVNASMGELTDFMSYNIDVEPTFDVDWYLPYGTTMEIKEYDQYFIFGDMYLMGDMILPKNSQLIVVNGDIILSGGTISGDGDIYSLDLLDIDTYTTSVNLIGTTLFFNRNLSPNAYYIDLSYFKFTGNTLNTNIENIYVSNLLSPTTLTINGKLKQETNTVNGNNSIALGTNSTANGNNSFIHSTNSTVSGDRSIVLGGQGITGSTSDTVYVPNLNINYTPVTDNFGVNYIMGLGTDGSQKGIYANEFGSDYEYGDRVAFVDNGYGNDGTGLINRPDRPFSTPSGAANALLVAYPNRTAESPATIIIRPGYYGNICYLYNYIYYHCEKGVVFYSGGFYDVSHSIGVTYTSKVTGNAVFVSQGVPIRPSYTTRVDIEFDYCDNTSNNGAMYFDTTSSGHYPMINMRANMLRGTTPNGYLISCRGNGDVTVDVKNKIEGFYAVLQVRGNVNMTVNCPDIRLLNGGPSGNLNNFKQAVIAYGGTSTGRFVVNGNITSYLSGSMGGSTNGCVVSWNSYNGYMEVNGDINAGYLYAVRMFNDTKFLFNGTIRGYHTLLNLNNTTKTHVKNSNLIRTGAIAVSPLSLVGSSILYMDDTEYYSEFSGHMINLEATGTRLYMNNVVAEGGPFTGTIYFVNDNSAGAQAGLNNVFANRTNDPATIQLYSTSGFTYEPNIKVFK